MLPDSDTAAAVVVGKDVGAIVGAGVGAVEGTAVGE
jgi:hypothetical protein